MRGLGQQLDLSLYVRALPLYARNLGVALPPLVAAIVGQLLAYAAGPMFAAVGGLGAGLLTSLVAQLVIGFAFAVAVIFADDAWRHDRAHLATAWNEARRKAGNIVITTFGFFFIIYVAGMIGAQLGVLGSLFTAVALFFLIYAIAATAIGGIPAQGAFSKSIQMARAFPLQTAILTIVAIVVGVYVANFLPSFLSGYVTGIGYTVLQVVIAGLAQGYVALVVAKQYADLAFRGGSYW